MGDLTVEQCTGPITYLGEGPVWHASWRGLRWVDALAGDLLTLDDASGAVHRDHVANVLTAFRDRLPAGFVPRLLRRLALPPGRPAGAGRDRRDHRPAPAFGGPKLDRLYITTAQKGIDPATQPAAGSLFCCDPGVTGVPVLEFAG